MKSTKPNKVLIAYVPVPHAGYLKLFRAFADSQLYVLGKEFIREFKPLTRHLPGVTPTESKKMIQSLGIFSKVHILTQATLKNIRHARIIMPDEDVAHALAEKYLSGTRVEFATDWRLRWDWGATQLKRKPENETKVSFEEFDRSMMALAYGQSKKSPDWWRQIGAVLQQKRQSFGNPRVLYAYNRHVPNDQIAYCYGDPRSNFEPGQCIDASVALHAEAGVIAEAARLGVCLEGASLWVTTFPCPPCAYLCAYSGIQRLYYAEGYALVAGAEVLQSKAVEIIRVEMGACAP